MRFQPKGPCSWQRSEPEHGQLGLPSLPPRGHPEFLLEVHLRATPRPTPPRGLPQAPSPEVRRHGDCSPVTIPCLAEVLGYLLKAGQPRTRALASQRLGVPVSSSLSAHHDLLPVTAALLARPLTPSLPRPLHVVSQRPLDERQPFQPGTAITSQGRSHPCWLCGRGPSPRASTGTSEAPWGLLFPSSSTFARLCRGLPFPTGLSSSEGRGTVWKLPAPWARRPPGFAGEKLGRRLRRGPDAGRWDSTPSRESASRGGSPRCPRRGAGWLRSAVAGSPPPYVAAPQARSRA